MSKRHARAHGRSGKDGRYVRLLHFMTRSAAWQSLDGNSRAIYIEMAGRYAGTGSNNGRIPYSLRDASKSLSIGHETAARCLRKLQERGFIVERKKGGFSRKMKHATEWWLTEFACDVTGELAVHAYSKWSPEIQNTVPVVRQSGACSKTVDSHSTSLGACSETVKAQNTVSLSHHRSTTSLPGGSASGRVDT